MRKIILTSLAALPLIACESTSVGVGVGGVSGNVGGGVSVSTPVGGSSRTTGSDLTVTMYKIDAKGIGEEIGTLSFANTRKGLRIDAALGNLPPGPHGFHIHEKPDCGPGMKDGKMQAGIAAGEHFDPKMTKQHLGPDGGGHRGDLPVLDVDKEGNATGTYFVLRLGINDLRGHALMIHEGGDNYADQPKPLGGGGARIACGTVSAE
jgi:superoxide dismutase, Cu-Zn family